MSPLAHRCPLVLAPPWGQPACLDPPAPPSAQGSPLPSNHPAGWTCSESPLIAAGLSPGRHRPPAFARVSFAPRPCSCLPCARGWNLGAAPVGWSLDTSPVGWNLDTSPVGWKRALLRAGPGVPARWSCRWDPGVKFSSNMYVSGMRVS